MNKPAFALCLLAAFLLLLGCTGCPVGQPQPPSTGQPPASQPSGAQAVQSQALQNSANTQIVLAFQQKLTQLDADAGELDSKMADATDSLARGDYLIALNRVGEAKALNSKIISEIDSAIFFNGQNLASLPDKRANLTVLKEFYQECIAKLLILEENSAGSFKTEKEKMYPSLRNICSSVKPSYLSANVACQGVYSRHPELGSFTPLELPQDCATYIV